MACVKKNVLAASVSKMNIGKYAIMPANNEKKFYVD